MIDTTHAAILVAVLLCFVVGSVAVLSVSALIGGVPRRRVEEFAKLHSLTVTANNGNQIIAYRATTRRWRTLGLLTSIVVQIVVGHGLTVVSTWALAGWFAGAIVAELRVAHLARGERAAASLVPRESADYLPPAGRWAVPGALVLCVAAAFAAGSVGPWTVLGLAIGAVALAAHHRVLRRPQPQAEPDRIAADDAIRSRSLHVLAASGMVLVLYCVLGQLDASHRMFGHRWAVTVTFAVGAPLAGRVLAYWPWAPKRDT